MNFNKSVSSTLYLLVAIHILVIGYNAYEVKSIVESNKLNAEIINLAGKIRGGIQGTLGQFAFGNSYEESADAVNQNFEILKSDAYQSYLDSGAALVLSLDRSWQEVELKLLECDTARQICMDQIARNGKDLWNQADTMVDFFQREADRKFEQLNRLYWILGLELLIITGVIVYIYASITKRLEREHKENLEYVDLIDRHIITSKTDVKGNITYVSAAFAQISGYRKDELMGKNHRIVRHPDMPDSLYKDLWETISSGNQWEGEIKNRKKDGSYYWVKAFISPRIENNRIVGYSAVREDITDQKRVEEISTTDALTGLNNRLKLDEILKLECQRVDRFGHPLSIIIIDLDYFKSVNDTYGHLTGDQVLIELAEVIQGSCRDTDFAGRWGGEEFLIICPETDTTGAMALAEKVRSAIEKFKFSVVGKKTASFGVACRTNKEKIDRMLSRADIALYSAKENGRNRVVISGEEHT